MSVGRLVVFLAVFGSVLGGLHYYAWARIVRAAELPPPWQQVAGWALAVLCVLVLVAAPASFVLPRRLTAPLLWVAYTWMGVAFFLVVLVAVGDLARLALALARQLMGAEAIDPERRVLLSRAIAGAVVLGTAALSGFGLAEGLAPVRVKRIQISLRRLRTSRVGYTIVQLSDIHVGPTIGRHFVEDLVARTNALAPDLIVITGDLVDGSVTQLGDAVSPLAGLKAKDGVFFVTGNHEYYSGVDEWLAYLGTLGIRVLRNERVSIGGSDGFDLAGVDDWSAGGHGHGHGPDLGRALEGRDRRRPVILLAHQPKQIFEAAQRDVDLQLSGHTHGGQMFPFGYLVQLQQPYVAGFHVHEGTAIYVSRGTGYWGPPMRVGAPAEITHIVLAMS